MTSDARAALLMQMDVAIGLLERALERDAKRQWWYLPDRLWVGRVEHALATLLRARRSL